MFLSKFGLHTISDNEVVGSLAKGAPAGELLKRLADDARRNDALSVEIPFPLAVRLCRELGYEVTIPDED